MTERPEGGPDAPLFHVERPMPEWATLPPVTVCGRLVSDVARALEIGEARDEIRRLGQQRAALAACMVCCSRAGRYDRGVLRPPEIESVTRYFQGCAAHPDDVLAAEVQALALLARVHWGEYVETVEGLLATTSLDKAREERRARIPEGPKR